MAILDSGADVPLLAKLELAHVAALVEALDHAERSVIVARYWREREPADANTKSYRPVPWSQIAHEMNRNESAVRRLEVAALELLRYWLRPRVDMSPAA